MQNRQSRPSVRSREAGFSLIEIIIVVTIIALIAAFVASKVFGGSDRAKVKLAMAQVQTLAGKVEQYQQDVGGLPASLVDLTAAPEGTVGWLGPYAKQADFLDPWNRPFIYRTPGDGKPFELVSLGADGQVGGESVKADIKFE